MSTGSGSAWPLAGRKAIASSIWRPSGASWSSGTARLAQCASTAREPTALSEQDSNSMVPRRRLSPAVAPPAPSPVPGALQAASATVSAAATSTAGWVARRFMQVPRLWINARQDARGRVGVTGRAFGARSLLAADVLLAADPRHREPVLLQRFEAGVDHVGVAAEVGDVAVGRGR